MQTLPSILVIDDDAEVRDYLTLALQIIGRPVFAATTLPSELNTVGVALVDLLLEDGRSGVPLVSALAAAGVPTIVMSGLHPESSEVQAALAAGAVDLLPKPFVLAELRDKVRSILS